MERIYLSKEQLEFYEIIKETHDYKIISKANDLAVAATIKGLLSWCDELEHRGIASVTPDILRKELYRFVDGETNLKEILKRIQEDKKMKLL